jgi:hypothetical protein
LETPDWLRGLSLERYAETFRGNAIDAVLPELSEANILAFAHGPTRALSAASYSVEKCGVELYRFSSLMDHQ